MIRVNSILKLQTNLVHKGVSLKREMAVIDGERVVTWYQKDKKSELQSEYIQLGKKESADMELIYMDEYGVDPRL